MRIEIDYSRRELSIDGRAISFEAVRELTAIPEAFKLGSRVQIRYHGRYSGLTGRVAVVSPISQTCSVATDYGIAYMVPWSELSPSPGRALLVGDRVRLKTRRDEWQVWATNGTVAELYPGARCAVTFGE